MHPARWGAFKICRLVIALRAKNFGCTNCSIDMNALQAIAYCGVPFSIDINALQAIAYCGVPFSIDMNALQAIAGISRRETMSIEQICRYSIVRRTLTAIILTFTKS